MPGFQKDAMQDLLTQLQRDVNQLKRQSGAGKILPVDLTLVASSSQPTGVVVTAEYYRHNDFVNCWFSIQFPTGFNAGIGAYTIRTPWQMRTLEDVAGTWRGSFSTGTSLGTIFYATPAVSSDQIYLWYLNSLSGGVGSLTQWTATTPTAPTAGAYVEGQFTAHVMPGY